MTLQFTKATKERAKLRLAIFGPAGSGKTYTSLRLAAGLGEKIAVIDTERGSASKYAGQFDFDVLELPKVDIDTYIAGMRAAAGYDVLIIDSMSHAWFELLDEVERLARAKYQGNTWSAWSEGTPKQRGFMDALLALDLHVIATMRVKTEWDIQRDERTGKSKPVRIGLAPQQGKGIEYEFDMLMELSPEHTALVTKDRTGKFQDQTIDMPGEELGASLAEWLREGAEPVKAEKAQAKKAEPKAPAKPEVAKPTNGTFDKATWYDHVLAEIPYYKHRQHVINTLKQLGYTAIVKAEADTMYEALAAHAKAKADAEADA